MDQICEAVGITQRTFFNHYSTKEDALLGLDLPQLNQQRAREYLADPAVGVLSGAIALIEFPAIYLDEPAFATAQLRLLAGSSALRSRQAERFAPVALELEELVYLKLRAPNGNDATDGELRQRASLVISLGAGLLNRVALAAIDDPAAIKPGAAEELFDLLRPIWQSLL